METSLHRDLKYHFAPGEASVEVDFNGYRIDAIDDSGNLVEIQHASLSSIRDKIQKLLKQKHPIRIIKPIVRNKWLETYTKRDGDLLRRRKSPKQGRLIEVFGELLHFTRVFPHPCLTLELLEVDCIEKRVDRPQHRWRRKRYVMMDQTLAGVGQSYVLKTANDLWQLIGSPDMNKEFDTLELATAIREPRWFAQQIAYTLRQCGAIEACGKKGNAILYRRLNASRKKAA